MTRGGDGAPPVLTTTGGRGSVRYTLAEIARAGERIQHLAEHLDALIGRAAAERGWLAQASAPGPGYPQSELGAIDAAVWRCRMARFQTAGLGRDTAAAARNYEAAEARSAAEAARWAKLAALWDGLLTWGLGPLGAAKSAGDALGWSGADGGHGYRDAVEAGLNNGGAYAAGVLGPGMALLYLMADGGRSDPATAGAGAAVNVRRFADSVHLFTPGRLEVRQVPAIEWDPAPGGWAPGRAVPAPDGAPGYGAPGYGAVNHRVDATVAGLLAGSQDAYGYPPGSIVVDRLDRADGSRAWIVHLPGTEDWSAPDTGSLFDLAGDLEGLTAPQAEQFGARQVMIQELMRQALADAGALPTEDVLITGHSGGGIHAAAAAASPAFLADVHVRMIVIAGAPAKNLPVAPGIDVLDLQNDDDVVTALDFGPPPQSPQWVSVTSHRPGATDGMTPLQVVGEAHDLGNYLQDAKALENSDDPAIAGSRDAVKAFLAGPSGGAAPAGGAAAGGAAVAGVLAGGTVTVSRRVYQGTEVKSGMNDKQGGAGNKKRADNQPPAR